MSLFAFVLAATISTTPVPSGASIAIDTTAANEWIGSSVEVQAWNRPEISIDQDVKNGTNDDVKAAVERSGNTITVTAQYTGERKSSFFGLIRSTNGKSFHWVVHMPADHALAAHSSNGKIEIQGVTAPLTVRSSNGHVTVSGAGPIVDAETANGSVDVGIATLSGGPPRITVLSSNGSIHLRVPRGFSSRVNARTSNGHIDNPFENGNGAGSASLRTSNGSIDVSVGS